MKLRLFSILFLSAFSFSYSSDIATVKIGNQTWMKFNLNVEPTGNNNAAANSWCYDNDKNNCDKYGRLYDWATAMALPEKCNEVRSTNDTDCAKDTANHQGLCPAGYHIPNNKDWNELHKYIDIQKKGDGFYDPDHFDNYDNVFGTRTSHAYLKSADKCSNLELVDEYGEEICKDIYGFSALPGGFRSFSSNFVGTGECGLLKCKGTKTDKGFSGAGECGLWWSAGEHYKFSRYANLNNISYIFPVENCLFSSYEKSGGFSVRCIKD